MQPRRKPKKYLILALTVVLAATALTLTSSKWLTVQHMHMYGKNSGDEEGLGNISSSRSDRSRTARLQPADRSAGTQQPSSGLPEGGGRPADRAIEPRVNSSSASGGRSGRPQSSTDSRRESGPGGSAGGSSSVDHRSQKVADKSHDNSDSNIINNNNSNNGSRVPGDKPRGPAAPRKVFGYECTQNACGGWADRQKGMVAAYVIAALLDREFKLEVTVPCPLQSLLQPNKTDWRVERSVLDKPDVQRIYIIDGDARNYFIDLQKRKDLDDVFPARVTLLTSNMEAVQFLRLHPLAARVPWLQGKSVEDIYRQALTDLFAPAPALQAVLDSFKAAVPAGKKLVCAHMRIGSDAVSNDVRKFHSHDQFAVLASFLARYNHTDRYRIVVTSDSQKVIEMARTQFPAVTISSVAGPLAHIEKTSDGTACDGFKRALAEQRILSTCDVLVQSESGFSKVAGFLRGRDDQLYVFRDAVLPCRRQDAYLLTDAW